MAAVQQPDDTPFRFLDLPAELRVAIYDFYFEISASNAEMDLLEYRTHLPPSNVTLVCRQIHGECQGLFDAKRSAFLRDNTFLLTVGSARQEGRATILRDVRRLPSALRIRKLAFQHTSAYWLAPIRIEAKLQADGLVRLKLMFRPQSDVDVAVQARIHEHALGVLQSNWGNLERASASLNIELCLNAFCSTFS